MKPSPYFALEWKWEKAQADRISGDPIYFNVSYNSKKIERCKLGSSIGELQNWDCWTIEMSTGLNSKLFTSTVGLAMLDEMPWTSRVMKSRSVLLWPPARTSIFGDSSWALRLFSSLCFFLLIRKALLIFRSRSYAKWTSHKSTSLHISKKSTLPRQSKVKWKINNKQKHLVTFIRLTWYL